MANEVATLDNLNFDVDFVPAEITITNAGILKQEIIDYAQKFNNLVVTEDTLPDSKNVKKQLTALRKSIDRQRIDIHNRYDQPYKDFATEIKEWQAEIDKVLVPIDKGIKELTEKQKQERADEVNALIQEMAPKYNVDPTSITIDSSWLTASISKTKREKEIASAMKLKKADNDRIQANIDMITEYAKARKIDPAGWISQVRNDNNIELIKNQIDDEVKRRDEDAKKAEIDRQNKADYKAAMENLKREQQGNNTVDKETGEIVEKTIKFWVKSTPEKLRGVQKYLQDNEIEYGSVN